MLNTLLSFVLALLIISTTWADNTATDVSPKKDKAVYPLLQLKILSVSENWINEKKAIVISFSHPLKPDKNYDSFLSITEDGIALKGHWQLSKDSKQLYFVNIKDDKQYQIFIRPGLVANNGLKILSPKQFNLNSKKTEPSLNFGKLREVYSPTNFSSIHFQSKGITKQEITIYRLNPENKKQFINKLKSSPNLTNWEVSDIESLSSLVEQQVINNSASTAQQNIISLTDKNLQTGLYFVSITATTESAKPLNKIAYFALSDFDMEIDKSKAGLELITYSSKQAKLLSDSKLTFISKDKIIKSKLEKTAYQYLADMQPTWVIAENNQQIILKKIPSNKQQQIHNVKNHSHIILTKKIYELGSKLDYAILARNADNKALNGEALKIVLLDAEHKKVSEKLITTSTLGMVSGYFQLPKENDIAQQIALKKKQISILKGGRAIKSDFQDWVLRVYEVDDNQNKLLTSVKFYTTTIKTPEVSLAIRSDSDVIFPNKPNKFTLQGMLNQQVAAAQASIDISQTVRWNRFPSKKYQEFSFGAPKDASLDSEQQITNIQLNSKGKANFTLPKVKNQVNSVLSVQLKGDLKLDKYPLATTVKDLKYWPANRLVGVRSLHWGSEDVSLGITFEIINIDPDDNLHAIENLEVKVYQEDIKTKWQYTEGLAWQKNKKTDDKLVEEKTLSLLSDDIGSLDLALDAGNYRMEIYNPETDLLTVYPFAIGNVVDSNLAPDQLKLSIDKKRYQKDDIVSLLIESRQAGEANISLYSKNESYSVGSISLNKGKTNYQFSLKELKKNKKLSKQFLNKDLKIQVVGFYSYKNEIFTAKGIVTLPIEHKQELITAKLQDNAVLLHSEKYKNTPVVIAVTDNTNSDNLVNPKQKLQSSYFDKQGNAIINNAEMQLKTGHNYQIDLYFADQQITYSSLIWNQN